ncbi:MAG: MaoC/PaaZ C-terminal domain-containing protein [Sinimarinibacterium sp.]|jgi:acyl dehydratase
MLDYHAVRNWDFGDIEQAYTERDTMLYALGVGFGEDPFDIGQLRYVYEERLQTLPTMASVLGTPGSWWEDPRTGADYRRRVHGEQSIEVFAALPRAGTVVARNHVLSITDKGEGKGAVAVVRRDIRLKGQEQLLARATQVIFLRGDGGYSRQGGGSDPGPEPLAPVPETAPDAEVALGTIAQQALVYRLSGDYNPLHSDPEFARAAGYSRPILHGLSTFGMAAHAVIRQYCGYDATRIRRMAVRFTSPVLPGETVNFELWRADAGCVRFRARVAARNTVVLDRGLVELL